MKRHSKATATRVCVCVGVVRTMCVSAQCMKRGGFCFECSWGQCHAFAGDRSLRVRVKIMGLITIRTDRDFPTILHFGDPLISTRTRSLLSGRLLLQRDLQAGREVEWHRRPAGLPPRPRLCRHQALSKREADAKPGRDGCVRPPACTQPTASSISSLPALHVFFVGALRRMTHWGGIYSASPASSTHSCRTGTRHRATAHDAQPPARPHSTRFTRPRTARHKHEPATSRPAPTPSAPPTHEGPGRGWQQRRLLLLRAPRRRPQPRGDPLAGRARGAQQLACRMTSA
eukprot:COSAG01_NODE_1275_length_10938_cov_100.784482_9_plen_287_part_00